jgi:hypothetical protein
MSRLFLDPDVPLSTCAERTCGGCPVRAELYCHFGARDLLRFMVIAVPPFVAGGIGMALVNALFLIPWVAVCAAYFGFVEIRVMCSHCPHYAEPGTRSLRCWANYGSPKLWRYRPGPMTRGEKLTVIGGLAVIAGFPAAVLLAGGQWMALAVFGALAAVMAAVMRTLMCRRCMNLACPLNAVPADIRSAFFARNPSVAGAWKYDGRNA